MALLFSLPGEGRRYLRVTYLTVAVMLLCGDVASKLSYRDSFRIVIPRGRGIAVRQYADVSLYPERGKLPGGRGAVGGGGALTPHGAHLQCI